ncbi:15600_t:CDS:2 [Dentiscutata heterogama]|uniref:15600_t:CDS:1 n=1 Tax=Dentiscutata heterogama TaxID=1316150 RepID=A0ACA9PU51_9GLOM|nr:15600_t:CDS:2 [Dentiscutata heterogama]
MKEIAKALDTIFENLNETNSKLNHINEVFEQYQETVSIQATKLQDMDNNLNTTFQETFSTLSMNILEIYNKVTKYTDDQNNILNILEDIRSEHSHEPLSEIINPKNKLIKNSTRYFTSHPTLWNPIRYKINSHQNSENIDKTSFKFNLEKPLGDHYNRKRINNYIRFYLEDYNKRSEDLQQRELWSKDAVRDIIIGYVGYLHK